MDVQRSPEYKKKKKRRQVTKILIATMVLAGITWYVWTLEPAPPTVEATSVMVGTVEKGPFVRSVRGPGTLVPEEVRWIAAETDGLVEHILIEPGADVTPESVILVLTNPVLEQQAADAALALRAAESGYVRLEMQLAGELLVQKAGLARIEASWRSAKLQAEADKQLSGQGLVPDIQRQQSELAAEQWRVQYENEKERLAHTEKSHQAQLEQQRSLVGQQQSVYDLRRRQLGRLEVRPGISGVLQEVVVEAGQRLAPGTLLARVAKPDVLKAELRISETQTRDIRIGQSVAIDTRGGVIPGRVARVDPVVQEGSVLVDVKLDAVELPGIVRPDLSVDGVIELERIDEAVYVQRPTFGQAYSTVGLFQVDENDLARRTPVELGRISVRLVEVVAGLEVGDRVILSDTSRWDGFEVLQLR